jgi:hypothetical protein
VRLGSTSRNCKAVTVVILSLAAFGCAKSTNAQSSASAYDHYLAAAREIKNSPTLRMAIDRLETEDIGYLVRARRAKELGGACLSEVVRGSAKFFLMAPLTVASRFPTVEFRKLGVLVAASAYALAAQGESARAVELLDAGITFGDRVSRLSAPAFSSGNAVISAQLRMMAALAVRLDMESLAQAITVLNKAILLTPRIRDAATREYEMWSSLVDEVCGPSWSKWIVADDDAEEQQLKKLETMTGPELAVARRTVRDRYRVAILDLSNMLTRPMPDWTFVHAESSPSIGDLFVSKVPIDDNMVISEQVVVVRLRLCRLALEIEEYRLLNRKLPPTLSLVSTAAGRRDPLTGTEFVYQPTPYGFDLMSKGTPATGQILLDRLQRTPERQQMWLAR